jgi:DNA-binding response OmpR family regulator
MTPAVGSERRAMSLSAITALTSFAERGPDAVPDTMAESSFRKPGVSRATVLIVDDDAAVTRTFAQMLTLEGFDVRTALDAESGLREAEDSHLDAILLDLRMPLQDGLAFLQRLRAREAQRHTPVAIVTGDYFIDDLVSGQLRELGAELHFKPLWLEDVVRLAHALVDGGLLSSSSNDRN